MYFECTNRTNDVPRRIIYNYYYNLLKQKEHYDNICARANVFEKKRKSEKKKVKERKKEDIRKDMVFVSFNKKNSSVSRLFCICTSFCFGGKVLGI